MDAQNSNKMQIDYLLAVASEIADCLITLANGSVDIEYKKCQEYTKKAIDEIIQAFNKEQAILNKNISIKREDILCKLDSIHRNYPEIVRLDDKYFSSGAIREALILCKKKGVFPYYTALTAAAAFHYILQDKKHPITKEIIKSGIRLTVERRMNLQYEPEIVYLVVRAFNTIAEGNAFCADERKIEIMKLAYEEGFKNEALYGGCSQCLIKGFYAVSKQDDEKAAYLFKAAGPLSGGGAGCNDGSCGAYTGANMIIGTYAGKELASLDNEVKPTNKRANDMGRIVHDKFIETYGTVVCSQVHQQIFGRTFNFRKEEDKEEFDKSGAHVDKCCCVVGMANAWLCEALYDDGLLK